MLLTPEILTILILDTLFVFFASISFILSIKISLKWDLNSTSQAQYKLERESFLASTIIKYIFMLKIPLFLFFIFTLNKLAIVIPGAMCGAGVVNATVYGNYLLVLKVLNLYIFASWLTLHLNDIKQENQPYTKLKFTLFIFVFFLLMSEIYIEWLMFNAIDINKIVDCCGTLYSSGANSYISEFFKIDTSVLLTIFYGTFSFIIASYLLKNRYTFSILNLVFMLISIITLIIFFGIYIYELPTHHCPFCLLQKDYYYIGYFLYTFLYLGTFYGISSLFNQQNMKKSLFFNTLYMVIVSCYPIFYYLKNGVFL